ncbi:hypothetical protein BU17DRAFT_65424 [Hysterangium stoloniferum]|nr:hypothetical protein BU17DRAFT_65424 [Hysterangium stoloniferum]
MPASCQSKSSVNGKKYNAKTVTEKISLKTLISTAKASKDEHGFSKSTLGSYKRALHQAIKWLQEQLEAEASFECPPGCPDIIELCFTKGFNGKELKKGIAEQTYSAWKKFWDNSFMLLGFPFLKIDPNGLYHGVWHWDPEKKIARGNLASAPEVKEIVKAVIARDAALGILSLQNCRLSIIDGTCELEMSINGNMMNVILSSGRAGNITLVKRVTLKVTDTKFIHSQTCHQ